MVKHEEYLSLDEAISLEFGFQKTRVDDQTVVRFNPDGTIKELDMRDPEPVMANAVQMGRIFRSPTSPPLHTAPGSLKWPEDAPRITAEEATARLFPELPSEPKLDKDAVTEQINQLFDQVEAGLPVADWQPEARQPKPRSGFKRLLGRIANRAANPEVYRPNRRAGIKLALGSLAMTAVAAVGVFGMSALQSTPEAFSRPTTPTTAAAPETTTTTTVHAQQESAVDQALRSPEFASLSQWIQNHPDGNFVAAFNAGFGASVSQ